MPNMFCTDLEITECYDLKGSVRNRNVSQEEIDAGVGTLKDINFNRRCSSRGTGIMLTESVHRLFLKQLASDANLLQELDIMDYSLLLGVASDPAAITAGEGSVSSDAA